MSNIRYNALEAAFEAQRTKALATFELYFTNGVGVGEHPSVMEELERQIGLLADAESKLECLRRNLKVNGDAALPEQTNQ